MFSMQWSSVNLPVFEVLLVLVSFVLSWGEAWFLDFRVLREELQAVDYLQGKKFECLFGTVKERVV
jgi:hypothetical protein